MSEIIVKTQTVYYSPTAKRTFITKKGAAAAEAKAKIKEKYPTEWGDPEEGGGFHWRHDMPNAEKLFARYTKVILKSIPRGNKLPTAISALSGEGKDSK